MLTNTAEFDLADVPHNMDAPMPEGVIARIVLRRDGGIHTIHDDQSGRVQVVTRESGETAVIYVLEEPV